MISIDIIIMMFAALVIGSIMGVSSGIVPGIGHTICMTIAFPFLLFMHPLVAISYYLGVLVVSQYMGGVGGILLGIASEIENIPSTKEGYAMTQRGQADIAIKTNALASLMGSVFAATVTMVFLLAAVKYIPLYHSGVQSVILITTMIITCFAANNRLLTSIAMMALGFLLGRVGYDINTGEYHMTFGNIYLMAGIPPVIVFVCLYGLPNILNTDTGLLKNIRANVVDLARNKFSMPMRPVFRGSLIGYFLGFIPTLTYILAANAAYSYEKYLQRKTYVRGDQRLIAANESANMSGVLTVLIPLLIFGVPITASEAIVYELMSSKISITWTWFEQNLVYLIGAYALANLFGFACSWTFATKLTYFFSRNFMMVRNITLVALVFAILYIGYINYQIDWYLILMVIFGIVGILMRKIDTIPLVFGFILQEEIGHTLSIFYQLYIR